MQLPNMKASLHPSAIPWGSQVIKLAKPQRGCNHEVTVLPQTLRVINLQKTTKAHNNIPNQIRCNHALT